MRKHYTTAKLEVILFNQVEDVLLNASGMTDGDNYFIDPDSQI